MCGIAGFVGAGDSEVLHRMTRRLTHRGPDAEGYFEKAGEGIFLGHRRLSIIDLAGGAQPMCTADGQTVIVFNGEIYNHAELRQELQAKGRGFATDHSDTEVLLQAWREWGVAMLDRLNGMWAFAIFDAVERRIFLARDRFGKKPLYYFHRKGTFAFASELTALLEHPLAPRNRSEIARVKFLAHALIPAPHSAIEGIYKLPAAHHLTLPLGGGSPRLTRYWRYTLEPEESGKSESALASELLEILARATKRRLVADVPLGVFLSGGLDSSTIAALATKDRRAGGTLALQGLQTFTIGFHEASFDESMYAQQVAEFLQTNHHVDTLSLDAALEVIPRIFDVLDEPQGDGSLLPTWLLCRFARRHVTVALSGDGGDELFAGYDPFRALRMAGLYSKMVPRPLHKALRLLAARLPVSHANISLDFKIKRTLRGLDHPSRLWNPVWLGALEPSELARLTDSRFSIEEIYSEAIEAWESCASADPVDRTLQFYTEIYLQDGILAKADRASMMNSLEVRSPFLDIEVADFARRLPHHYKLRGKTTKYLLKRAVEELLPHDIIYRSKKGFGTPVGSWLRSGRIAPEANSPMLREKLAAHLAGKTDERLYLWCEHVWQQWQLRNPS
ncbi:MAG: asparagine synthase (glutamine-hydrolyzing) [Spartobacteria bacterium AMD-G4]|nr:MAG: asparagine synthase (glutamine-hydrolyzing) [Spartobacteria bacterium AMD-G4]